MRYSLIVGRDKVNRQAMTQAARRGIEMQTRQGGTSYFTSAIGEHETLADVASVHVTADHAVTVVMVAGDLPVGEIARVMTAALALDDGRCPTILASPTTACQDHEDCRVVGIAFPVGDNLDAELEALTAVPEAVVADEHAHA